MIKDEEKIKIIKFMVADTKKKIDQQGKNDYMVGLYNGLELALSILENRDGEARLIVPENKN